MPHSVHKENKTDSHPNGSRLWARAFRRWRWLWSETDGPDNDLVHAPADLKPVAAADASKNETQGTFTNLLPFKIIAWLGASAGGLTILLVGLGFLALSAHDVMLGIPRSFQNNPEYVAVGGLFFARSIIFLVAGFIFAKSWIVLALVLLSVVVLLKVPRRHSRGRSLVLILFSIALLIGEVYTLTRLTIPLQISNLLLKLSADATTPAWQVIYALLENDTTWLRAEYGFLVLLVVALSVVFLLLEQAGRTRFWHVVRVPAFIFLIICFFLLPRAYGVLTIANDYPTVVLESSTPANGPTVNETRLLLREDDKVFVLYDPDFQSIVTVKRDSIGQHKMYAPQHAFTASFRRK